MKNYQITPHLSYFEICSSDTAKRNGIVNEPDSVQLMRIMKLALHIIEPLATGLSTHLNFSSVFRSTALNKAIGGATSSDHMANLGAAADIDNEGKTADWATNKQIFDYILKYLPFDQVIWESGDDTQPHWVHVGYRSIGGRKQVLRMQIIKGKKIYTDISKTYKA